MIINDGVEVWLNENNEFHRDDGPAFKSDHIIKYYKNGNLHNLKGPAILNILTGYKEWHINGISLKQIEYVDGKFVRLTPYEISTRYNIPIKQIEFLYCKTL